MTKKRPCTKSGFAKRELCNKNFAKKRKKHEKLNYGRHPV
jgi:hypothetical protein